MASDKMCLINNRLRTLSRIIRLLFQELRRRFYSNTVYQVLRRDLSLDTVVPEPRISLTLQKLRPNDVPKLLDIWKPGLSKEAIGERIRIRRMIQSGIQTPYVAVTEKDEPCHLAWLIDPGENEKIQFYFQKRVPPLKADEVLFEFIFTLEEYRGLGIQVWRSKKFTDKSVQLGARWSLGYIKSTNDLSLKNAAKNAFKPYMTRTDKWRLFCCKSEFKMLP